MISLSARKLTTKFNYVNRKSMKSNTLTSFAVVIFAVVVMMVGCKTASEKKGQVAGTMEEPVPSDMMPDHVQQALAKAMK